MSQEETVAKSSSADLASEELLQKRVRTDVPPPECRKPVEFKCPHAGESSRSNSSA